MVAGLVSVAEEGDCSLGDVLVSLIPVAAGDVVIVNRPA